MQKNNYNSIIKGATLFGGTQFFGILVNLLRGKLVALFLGPVGVGISSILTNTGGLLQQFGSMGTNLSAISDISKATESNDKEVQDTIIVNYRMLLIILAILSACLCFGFSEQLSIYTFSNIDYTSFFEILSFFVLFSILSTGEMNILQGKRLQKKVAIASILGSVAGLIVGTPFYYFWGLKGVVPAMVALALSSLITNRILNGKIKGVGFGNLELKLFMQSSKRMISLGFVLMISSIIGTLTIYYINVFITKTDGAEMVGYFQSANLITNQYVGLIFSAMAIDYFPKLAALSNSSVSLNKIVNEQIEIVLLLVTPILATVILASPIIIRLLLTSKFLIIVPLLNVMAVSVFFKSFAYPLGYISFAKGDKKTFFWLEGIFSNILQLSLNLIFYHYAGLIGLGWASILIFFIYSIVIYVVAINRYRFTLKKANIKLILSLLILLGLIFGLTFISSKAIQLSLGITIWLVLSCYSLNEINKRVSFISLIRRKSNGGAGKL